jgi:hypothetical protein
MRWRRAQDSIDDSSNLVELEIRIPVDGSLVHPTVVFAGVTRDGARWSEEFEGRHN